MDLEEKGKGFSVVGGSKGMGFEVAKLLAASGARIAIISRQGAEARIKVAALARLSG